MSRRRPTGKLAACAAVLALATSAVLTAPLVSATASPAAPGAEQSGGHGLRITEAQLRSETRPDEVRAFGPAAAQSMARDRIGLRAVQTDYPQTTRTARLKALTESQATANAGFDPAEFGRFTDYFSSPDFAAHIALLPTGKVLLFSFESVEENPQKEPAPTDVIGRQNAGRAYLWDPAAGTGLDAFKAVPPPVVDMPDGTNEPRPAPFFCAGHSYLPNGMVGVFGGNLGGNGGTGAKLALIFDPWTETWHRQQDMSVGRWYPTVVTGADGRQVIMSGQSELGWGTPTPVVERFPAAGTPVSYDPRRAPDGVAVDRWKTDAPYRMDYPHLFSLNDGKIYGFGRDADQQWVFDPADESRKQLPDRPDGGLRNYGSAVELPNGTAGPDSVLVLGGNRNDRNTYLFSGGKWTTSTPRAFGRTQDDTLILPNGNLFTVNGSYDIRDYGNGPYNPNADLKYRQTELRDADGHWRLGPVQRLPRGYHSNAVILPDGRIMVTGDELQQIANNPDIKSGLNGTIEIYEPPYLHQGPRPVLTRVPAGPVGYDAGITVRTSTPSQVSRAVLVAPITSTHAVDTSQRHLDLRITGRSGGNLVLRTPPSANAAPPGFYMLFLLDAKGVPSVAKWVQLAPGA
ncbi:galactose oxidase early set domain-containing protein [Streptomyces sp. V4-01]|uniref:Galactose oxidase early set domain-containing protein n=1 Tax=Actinacidiphila polyblastidii TaxID=3110430 RepID=A0ABU7PF31_9ACTN|nr:galactose oxidase early set domain-containing protein [Streptomyces sp. V4-01]